jgi:hypothetical protein
MLTPEALALEPLAASEIAAPKDGRPIARVLGREFLGREWLVSVDLQGRCLRVRLPLEQRFERGQPCVLRVLQGAEALLYPGALPVRPVPVA